VRLRVVFPDLSVVLAQNDSELALFESLNVLILMHGHYSDHSHFSNFNKIVRGKPRALIRAYGEEFIRCRRATDYY